MADGGSSGPWLATVLFTDAVGSTALRTRHGDAVADALRRAHDRLAGDAIAAHGGTLVKNLGDGLMATFRGPSDATAAAVAVQRGCAWFNRRADGPAELELRIGLSLGEVVWEDGDCFGTAVIEAARLCDAAGSGQILAAEVVRMLAGDRAGNIFKPVGALELKGLGEPLPTCEVQWQAAPGEAVRALPAALETEGRLPFVARESQLALLIEAWGRAASGERQAVFVSGEPGIGKTRLVSEAAGHAHADGALVLFGRCDHDVGIPYQPFVEALHSYVAGCSPEELRTLVSPLSGEIGRLVPALTERLPSLDKPMHAEPETERYRLFEAVVEFLAAITAVTPTVVVLDDLHWADKPSLLLLRHLLRADTPMRLLVVATYRDTDIEASHPLTQLLTDAGRSGFGQRVPLVGLDPEGVAALVAGAAQHELGSGAAQFARDLHAETDGNAFFVQEVLRHLIETGALVRREGRWTPNDLIGQLGVPEGVRDVVGQRLARLPDVATEVLAAAAVIGQEFDVDLLAGVVASGMAGVITALEAAETARLIVPAPDRPDRYRFSHALVLSTIYDGLATPRRRWLHRAVGLGLEARHDRDQRLGELAQHFGEAAPLGETDRAIRYAREAGDQASASLAFERAAVYYGRALRALESSPAPDPALRCDLLLARGQSLECAGDERFRPVLFAAADAARTIGDADRLARAALLFMHFGAIGALIDTEVLTLMDEALARLPEGDSSARAGLLGGLSSALLSPYGPDRRRELSREAVAMARRVGDPDVLARVLGTQHLLLADPEAPNEGIHVAREVVRLAEAQKKPNTSFIGYTLLYTSLVAAGDIDAADEALAESERLAAKLRQPFFAWWTTRLKAAQALLAGRGDDAEQLAVAALDLSRRAGFPEPVVQGLHAGQLQLIRQHQGRIAEVLDTGREAPGPDAMLAERTTWSLALCAAGRTEEARPLLHQLAANGFADLPGDLLWFESMITLATIAHLLEEPEAAEQLYALLLPYSGRNTWGGNGSGGPIDRALGVLAATMGRCDLAVEHLEAAITMAERMRAAGWAVRARGELAAVLARRDGPGDAERSRTLAAAVMAEAERLGMAGVLRDARAYTG